MNSHTSNGRSRSWPHALLESALLTSALLMASGVALANAPVVTDAQKAVVKELHQAKTYTITSPPTEPLKCQAGVARPQGLYRRSRLEKDRAQQAG